MSLSESLLPEFDQEMAVTRKTLERVPDDKFDWTPHEKSMTMGHLATHIAGTPSWIILMFGDPSFDIAPPGGEPYRPKVAANRAELVETFDKNVAAARAAITAATDEQWMQPWSLLSGGKTIFTVPRVAALRSMIMNHLVHHRAQLGVYLRLNDIPVPAMYGPSADES